MWELQFYTRSEQLELEACYRRWNEHAQGCSNAPIKERMIRYLVWWNEAGYEISDVDVVWVALPE